MGDFDPATGGGFSSGHPGYMDIKKFKKLISSNKLWLSRADKLGDDYEGASSNTEIKIREERWKHPEHRKKLKNGSELRPLAYFISCWTMNNPESNALWKIYAPKYGIAIESNVENLATCFTKKPIDFFSRYEPIIGSVTYEKRNEISSNLYFNPTERDFFLRKLKAFKYEKEIRLIMTSHQTIQGEIPEAKIEEDVNLDKLINRIYIYNASMKDNLGLFLKKNNLSKEIKVPFFRQKPYF